MHLWQLQESDELPLLATAIHDGHAMRPEVARACALDAATRRREEDPHTGTWARTAPTWLVVNRSRFEVDLNRPRNQAIYHTPGDAWGLTVWQQPLDADVVARSLRGYDDFYTQATALVGRLVQHFGQVVVYDLHTYCHRRDGPHAPPAPQEANPDINVGTGTMGNDARRAWAPVVETFMAAMRAADVETTGRRLDVRENVRFRGGNLARWLHTTFPQQVCVLSIEVKKRFMDEWSGTADDTMVAALADAIRATIPAVLDRLPCTHSTRNAQQ